MWIFGYGSLMWDGWEKKFGCLRKEAATLAGYARSFTKASTERWGTRVGPAPTLRVVPIAELMCHGMAFEFNARQAAEVGAYLIRREGKGFIERPIRLTLASGEAIDATTFYYEGKNIIASNSDAELAAMAGRAFGTAGSALDYIATCKRDLDAIGIVDSAVDSIWRAVQAL